MVDAMETLSESALHEEQRDKLLYRYQIWYLLYLVYRCYNCTGSSIGTAVVLGQLKT